VLDALRYSGAVAGDDPLATLAPAPLDGHEELIGALICVYTRLDVRLMLDDRFLRIQSAARSPSAASRAQGARSRRDDVICALGGDGLNGGPGADLLHGVSDASPERQRRSVYSAVWMLLA
jgi:hypothetical protein